MKKLLVQAFFDNTKGHEKQTRAILNAFNSLTPVNISESRVGPRSLKTISRFLLGRLNSRSTDPSQEENGPDLIIGTGSNCHLPMLIAGQQHPEAKIVTCMTPDKFLINSFDLCLVPIHDQVKDSPRIFKTIGPPCPAEDQHKHKSNKGLILIGGIDHKSHYWNTGEMIGRIEDIVNRHETYWTVSSSPRTPEDTLQALTELCTRYENTDFFRADCTPPGWIEERYHESSIAWVTADSVSMVYEALSAGCKVGILPVKWKREDNKFQRSLSILSGREMIVYLDDWLAGHPLPQGEASFNEARRCATEIINRCWPDRLS
jgi:mitochondrial fission protein ELM1